MPTSTLGPDPYPDSRCGGQPTPPADVTSPIHRREGTELLVTHAARPHLLGPVGRVREGGCATVSGPRGMRLTVTPEPDSLRAAMPPEAEGSDSQEGVRGNSYTPTSLTGALDRGPPTTRLPEKWAAGWGPPLRRGPCHGGVRRAAVVHPEVRSAGGTAWGGVMGRPPSGERATRGQRASPVDRRIPPAVTVLSTAYVTSGGITSPQRGELYYPQGEAEPPHARKQAGEPDAHLLTGFPTSPGAPDEGRRHGPLGGRRPSSLIEPPTPIEDWPV